MRRPSAICIALIAILVTGSLSAADTKGEAGKVPAKPAPEPPPPPENYNPPAAPETGDREYEPEVTITTKGTEIHEERRLNGRLYMIKVIPTTGKPYYLVDDTGDGKFRRSDLEPRIVIPMWVIKTF